MKASLYFGLSVTMVGLSGWVAGCGDDDTGSGATATSSGSTVTSGTTTTGATSGGGEGGATASSATSSGNGGAGGPGGAGGAGGEGGYSGCGECADQQNGAPMNECKATRDACFADQGCSDIHACVFGTPCESDAAGACCTLDCYASAAASQGSIDLYEAFDGCVYCEECAELCGFDEYCAAIADPMCQ